VPGKQRLDIALVDRGLAESRTRAQALVMARRVLVNGQYVIKSNATVRPEDAISVEEPEHPWVSRGGIKLAHALEHFRISVEGKVCADIGASTGGFTDVLLKRGAERVYAVDVGYGQLDARLRNDPRVELRERVNARNLTAAAFDEAIGFVCIDVSFISLRLILPAVRQFLHGDCVALIKPQFEVGREGVGKGGIVRDDAERRRAVDGILAVTRELELDVRGVIESPITGMEGNVEYLMHCVNSEFKIQNS
jgi:23S rRNA (cytidine1920-2'-O)/16S rRNA (cytidine1409-2'-O)-methyltransferase